MKGEKVHTLQSTKPLQSFKSRCNNNFTSVPSKQIEVDLYEYSLFHLAQLMSSSFKRLDDFVYLSKLWWIELSDTYSVGKYIYNCAFQLTRTPSLIEKKKKRFSYAQVQDRTGPSIIHNLPCISARGCCYRA